MMAGEEESSSGCRSGWTVYFDQSYLSPPSNKHVTQFESPSEESEEDLSMVSDASSGPPHFGTDEQHSEYGTGTLLFLNESTKKRKVDWLSPHFDTDDTASRPPISNHSSSTGTAITDIKTTAESVLEYSCAFSGTYKEESGLRNDTCYLQPIATPKLMNSKKKIKRRHGDTFHSWSSQKQPMQELM